MKSSVIVILLAVLLSSCYLGRIVMVNAPSTKDYKWFAKSRVEAGEVNFSFIEIDVEERKRFVPDSIEYKYENYELTEFLKDHKTSSFMIIRNDSILYEQYFKGYEEDSYVTTFSAIKSIVSALFGIALEEGLIDDISDPVTKYIPELLENDSAFGLISLYDVLNMRSGIAMNENYYNPFSDIGKAYFGSNLEKIIPNLYIESEPGDRFKYMNYNTQILGIILIRTTGKTLSEYLEEKLWKPLGMEYDAIWSLDSKRHGMEKAYCCFNGRTRDFARFGRLYLNDGKWEGKQIVPKRWVDLSTIEDTSGVVNYSCQWWLNVCRFDDYMAAGILGQYIYVYPEKNVIIVRFGKKKDHIWWERVFCAIVREL